VWLDVAYNAGEVPGGGRGAVAAAQDDIRERLEGGISVCFLE
jgi:hypothetical protein